jgi:hypothetical protein
MVDYSVDIKGLDKLLATVKSNFPRWISTIKGKKILFGFDGVLDEIYTVVSKRLSVKEFLPLRSIAEWAEVVKAAAGSAANFEIIEKRRSTGGFVANTAGALLALASPLDDVTLVGGFGTGDILPPFKDLFEKQYNCKVISIGAPGYTHAYEFDDGKLMMTSFASVLTLDVATIVARIPEQQLAAILEGTALFGLGYWSITPGMTDIFRFFAERVFPATRKPLDLFLDLASLRKRSEDDIRKVAAIINKFPDHVRVTLSLNDKEAKQLYEAVAGRKVAETFPGAGGTIDEKEVYDFLAGQLHQFLDRCHVIIHTPRFALSIRGKANEESRNQICIVPNAYTKQASFTVAAGDAFNGGVAVGLLAGCTPEQMLVMGNVATSHFIRTGVRCNQEQFIALLSHYKQYLQADHPETISSG